MERKAERRMITRTQLPLLQLAAEQGGRISSRQSIAAGLGPATPGLLANKGLLIDLGRSEDTQWYGLGPEAAEVLRAAARGAKVTVQS
jgi:hypothetical protein